jgi:hypothetical protein
MVPMTSGQFYFEWSKAYAKRSGQPAYEFRNGKICQLGTGVQKYLPLQAETLFEKFTALDGTPATCVAFAENYGLLTEEAGTRHLPSEYLSVWQEEIKQIAALKRMLPALTTWGKSRRINIVAGDLKVLLAPGEGPDALPRITIEPDNLLQAMRLQLAQFIAGGGTWINCQNEECGRPFPIRRARGEGAKRTIARFCSDSCRNRYHYLERTNR